MSISLRISGISWTLCVFQTLCAEIDIHKAHKDSIRQSGDDMVEAGHPQSEEITCRTQELQESWDGLNKLSDDYKAQLDLSLQAKQVCAQWSFVQTMKKWVSYNSYFWGYKY